MIDIEEEFNLGNHWGILTSIDLKRCNQMFIRDKDYLRQWVEDLVIFLDMEAYGEPTIVRFGKGNKEGYTVMQLIQTSNISAHFSEDTGDAYVDIFSCKAYAPDAAAAFCEDYLEAESATFNYLMRG